MQDKSKKKFETAKDILMSKNFLDSRIKSGKYISKEFQDFGYRLAVNLNDLEHKSLYMKLAKKEDRAVLQKALSFSMDYPNAKNKGKIFMWKLKEIKAQMKEKNKAEGFNDEGQKTLLF